MRLSVVEERAKKPYTVFSLILGDMKARGDRSVNEGVKFRKKVFRKKVFGEILRTRLIRRERCAKISDGVKGNTVQGRPEGNERQRSKPNTMRTCSADVRRSPVKASLVPIKSK